MRKTILSIFFLLACFSLYAQTFREARVYIPPVTGAGSLSENTFFYRLITYEVTLQYHSVVRSQAGSDYILRGSIDTYAGFLSRNPADKLSANAVPVPPSQGAGAQGGSYVFNLELADSKTGEITGEQYLIYSSIDTSVNSLVSVMIYNLFSCVPDQMEANDWRNNWFFLEASVLWSPRLYISQMQSFNWLNIGLGLAAEYQFLNFMSLGVGANFTQDWLIVSSPGTLEYRDLILEVPLSLKLVFKPGDHLMLELYGAFSVNLSMMQTTTVSPFSWSAGFQFGVKAGPGILIIDPRFTMDLYPSALDDILLYNRYIMQIGFGYKFGLAPKGYRDY